jgi:hypothetical protein
MPRRQPSVIAALLCCAAIVLAGCGVPTSPDQAIGDAAKVSGEVARMTKNVLGHWCPQAFRDDAKHLTHAEAKRCLSLAKDDYLGILHKAGFDPAKVVNGGK